MLHKSAETSVSYFNSPTTRRPQPQCPVDYFNENIPFFFKLVLCDAIDNVLEEFKRWFGAELATNIMQPKRTQFCDALVGKERVMGCILEWLQ